MEDANAPARDEDDVGLYSDGDVGANRDVDDAWVRWVYMCCERYEGSTGAEGENVAVVVDRFEVPGTDADSLRSAGTNTPRWEP
jgi:hypothetical protein